MDDSEAKVTSLVAARFERNNDPAAHNPTSALDAATDWIKNNAHKPDHIVVIVGRDSEDGGSMTKYFQAGKYRHHAQQGLCVEAMHMMRESKVDG